MKEPQPPDYRGLHAIKVPIGEDGLRVEGAERTNAA